MRRPLRYVPLRLSMSSRKYSSPRCKTRACWRETNRSGNTIWQIWCRPKTVCSSARWTDSPDITPLRTFRLAMRSLAAHAPVPPRTRREIDWSETAPHYGIPRGGVRPLLCAGDSSSVEPRPGERFTRCRPSRPPADRGEFGRFGAAFQSDETAISQIERFLEHAIVENLTRARLVPARTVRQLKEPISSKPSRMRPHRLPSVKTVKTRNTSTIGRVVLS